MDVHMYETKGAELANVFQRLRTLLISILMSLKLNIIFVLYFVIVIFLIFVYYSKTTNNIK